MDFIFTVIILLFSSEIYKMIKQKTFRHLFASYETWLWQREVTKITPDKITERRKIFDYDVRTREPTDTIDSPWKR